jgi:hypothetical protein
MKSCLTSAQTLAWAKAPWFESNKQLPPESMHLGGEVMHDGLSLDVQVLSQHHLVQSSLAEEADSVGVDVCMQEGHCAS